MNSVAVVVATYGDRAKWDPLAERALESIARQSEAPDEVIRAHGPSLQAARNAGVAQATTDLVAMCDADDQFDRDYVKETRAAGAGDIFVPSISRVAPNGRPSTPAMLPTIPLLSGNYIVIGAPVRRELFMRCGGFDDWPVYEDWALWIKLWVNGARIVSFPRAIYRVIGTPGTSRNSQVGLASRVRGNIVSRYLALAKRKGLA